MESAPLLSIIGALLVVVLTLLVSMVNEVRSDNKSIKADITSIKLDLTNKLEAEKYESHKREIIFRLDKQGRRLLKVEMKLRMIDEDSDDEDGKGDSL